MTRLRPLLYRALLFLFVATAPAGAQDKKCFVLEKAEIRGQSLAPKLAEGTEVFIHPLTCHPPRKGDLLVFTTGAHTAGPVIKSIAAQEGDLFEITEDGFILVNKIRAMAPDDTPYKYPASARKRLAFYQGILPPKTYLVLGRPGSLDSTRFGLVDEKDVKGIVFWPPDRTP